MASWCASECECSIWRRHSLCNTCSLQSDFRSLGVHQDRHWQIRVSIARKLSLCLTNHVLKT
jgi:hypothetical protein